MTSAHTLADEVRKEPFRPAPWLRSGHSQTLASAFMPRRAPPKGESWYVDTDPGTQVLCHGHVPRGEALGTTLVIVHGLGGSSESGHVLDILRRALDAGLSVVRMNMRNCGGTHHLTPTLYHANLSQDLRAIVEDLIAKRGARRVVIAGYSVGGNLTLNTLALWAAKPPPELAGAVVMCPAIDIPRCVELVDGNALYRRHYVNELMGLYAKKATLFPDRFQVARLSGVRTMRDFDRLATGPEAGFPDVDQFYAWVSSASRLGRIVVPTVVLHAADDPVVELLPATRNAIATNPMMAFVESESGGHCGFLESPSKRRFDGRWAADQIVRCAVAWARA